MILGAHGASSDLASLEPGTHLCALDPDPERLDRIAATFVGQGLAAGDRVLHVGSDAQAERLVAMLPARVDGRHARRTGQLVVRSFADTYGSRRPDDLSLIGDGFRRAAALARSNGFPALRVAARMDDLTALLGSVDEVVAWEGASTGMQRDIEVSSVCIYDSSTLDPADAAAIADEHAGQAAVQHVSPLATFVALDEPWGLAVRGEVDLSNRDLLQRAVLSRAAVDPRVHLDLSDLGFADVGTLTRLRSIAAALPVDGFLSLVHPPAVVRRVIAAAGIEHERLLVV